MTGPRSHWVAAAVLALATAAAVLVAQRDQGLARDEIVYMHSGSAYWQWWTDLLRGVDGTATRAGITARFGGAAATANNREHPPLMKTLFGASEALLHDRLGWVSEVTGYRLPTALTLALLVAVVVLVTAGAWGLAAGIVSGLLTALLPRVLFHAGLATFDVPVAALWFATVAAYYWALRSRVGCLVLGVTFGLALATKHNALMLPAVLLTHYLWLAWRRASRLSDLPRALIGLRPLVAVALVAIGPATLVALWPWLWFDTVAHLRDWIGFHLHHVHYNFEYLGKNWNAPPFPWHVPLVTTLFTVPVATLAAAAGGVAVWLWRARAGQVADDRGLGVLLALSAAVAVGPFVLGSTPIFGGEKHFVAAFPTLCILAGVAVVAAARAAVASAFAAGARPWLQPAAIVILGGAVTAAALAETAAAHPYALSHYNALAGGAPGAADLGLNRQFWGYAARGVLPWLNAHRQGDGPYPVYSHDASPAWAMYRRAGLVDARVVDAGREQRGIRRSRAALVIHERHFNRHDYLIWAAYGTVQPAFVLTTDGVPVVSVYSRPAAREADD
jgi:hypothetical protein